MDLTFEEEMKKHDVFYDVRLQLGTIIMTVLLLELKQFEYMTLK